MLTDLPRRTCERAREEILTRLQFGHIPPVVLPCEYQRGGEATVELLIDRLVGYGATVRPSTRAALDAAVA